MTFLPVVDRELRVAAREHKTYWSRVATAFTAIVFGGWLVLTMRWAGAGALAGRQVFTILTHIGFYSCLVAGVAYSSDAISRENREGTLGLLFLTDLKGYDIVLGKLAAGSLLSFYSLFATFPVLALPVMLGGVTWGSFVAAVVALANTLFFAHAFALLVSTAYRDAQKTVAAASIFLWLFVLTLPALQYLPATVPFSDVLRHLSLLSPGYAFAAAVLPQKSSVWVSLLLSNLLAWAFLAWASRRVTRCWKDKPIITVGWQARWRQWLLGDAGFRLALRRNLLVSNAYFWLISRERFRKAGVWLTLAAVIIVMLCFHMNAYDLATMPNKGEFLALVIGFHIALKIGVGSECSRYLDKQKRNGELEMLLSATPLRNEDIFAAHFLALKRLFLWPLATVLAADVLFMIVGCLQKDGTFGGVSAEVAYVIGCVTLIGMLLFDLWALRWTGMWMGIIVRRPGHGAGAAFSRIVGIPLLAYALIQIPLAFAPRSGRNGPFDFLILWIVICVVNNAIFVASAKRNLATDLRAYATSFSNEPLTLFGRIGRFLGRKI